MKVYVASSWKNEKLVRSFATYSQIFKNPMDVLELIERGGYRVEVIFEDTLREEHVDENATAKFLRLAKMGAAVAKGCTEIFQTTLCKGMYESEECNQVKEQCVLKYYCRLRKEGGE